MAWTDSDMLQENFVSFLYNVWWRRTLYQILVLDEIYNFVVQTFSIWYRLDVQIFSFQIIYLMETMFDFKNLKFEFFKWPWMEKRPKQKL
jgi:hypothetical protein